MERKRMASTSSASSLCAALLLLLAIAIVLMPPAKVAGQSCGVLLDQSGGAAQGVAGLNASVVAFKIELKTSYIVLHNITITFNHTLTDGSTVVQDSGGEPTGLMFYSDSVSYSAGEAVYSMSDLRINSTGGDYWILIGATNGPFLGSSQWLFVPWTVAPAGSALTIGSNYALSPSYEPVATSLVPPVVFAGCAASMNPSPPASTTPAVSITTTPTASGSPLSSLTPTTMATASLTPSPRSSLPPSRTPFPTPTPLPSPSGLPALVGVANMTANFDDAVATFNMSGAVPLGHSTAPKNAANVVSTFSGLQLGNVSVPAASLSDLARTVLNESSTDTTYVYSASIGDNNATRFDQSFTFYDRDANASFAGVSFAIPANSVKWSINFTVDDASSPSHTTQWSTVRYRLAGLLASSANGTTLELSPSTDRPITSRTGTPAPGLTTYYVPLFQKTESTTVVVAAVVLFDVALVDRIAADIRHRIVTVAVNATTIEYEVVFEFPPFNESLFYDPSLGLGVLLGTDRDGSGGVGGGSDNTGLIVGVAVAIPVAVVVVVVVIAVGLYVTWRRRSNVVDSGRAINFSVADLDDDDYEL